MKSFVIALLLGIILGAGATWYVLEGRRTETAQQAEQQMVAKAEQLKEKVSTAVSQAPELDPAKIQKELQETGRVIRRKVQQAGEAVADATADARIEATIKARLVKDPELSAWNISVDATAGRVTLSGRVSSYEQVGRAMALALDTAGVHEVVSTLQIGEKED